MYFVHKTIKAIGQFKTFKYTLMLKGALVGALTGILIVFFRLSVQKIWEINEQIMGYAHKNLLFLFVWIFILIFISLAISFLLKLEPMISGSGIPQVKADMGGELSLKWWKVIICKFTGCVLALGGGLSLGREGPSVLLGSMVGKGFCHITKRTKSEEGFLMTCGAGAGLTAAFNAPVAGAIFCLEEMNRNFSEKTLLTAMASTITADFIASYVFGLKPIFTLKVGGGIPLKYYWLFIALGVLLGIFGVIFNKCLDKFQNIYKQPFMKRLKTSIPFIMVFVLSFLYPVALGSGGHLVEDVTTGKLLISGMCLLFIIKFLFFMFCFGSGAPGGIFMPLLVFGAILGSIFGEISGTCFGFGSIYIGEFVIVGMAGYFAAVVRAPITGIILISEMTGTLSHLLALSLVSLVAYFTADILKAKPVYDQLLDRIVGDLKG
ncbi:ClC family H(+)/Cl(-) exchange transporter [Aminipila terrae]|uniref:ClC family H(+)/Cl(-) exchange transporter n=1 Tax=Aminipila terrae TaxID=2697030 RepID=A0A6P1MBT7_9FIRM|nr:ClC family H(+)/Cl(-) exchange transporter [Aminipila terrae]QHI72100.1 ClC family H(+)/Cl(-) exchange transporter [Aminipila terrae]